MEKKEIVYHLVFLLFRYPYFFTSRIHCSLLVIQLSVQSLDTYIQSSLLVWYLWTSGLSYTLLTACQILWDSLIVIGFRHTMLTSYKIVFGISQTVITACQIAAQSLVSDIHCSLLNKYIYIICCAEYISWYLLYIAQLLTAYQISVKSLVSDVHSS